MSVPTSAQSPAQEGEEGRGQGAPALQLAATLQGVYAAPGVAEVRTGQKEVSTGTAAIDALRALGPSSLTFVGGMMTNVGSEDRSMTVTPVFPLTSP